MNIGINLSKILEAWVTALGAQSLHTAENCAAVRCRKSSPLLQWRSRGFLLLYIED